MAVDAQRVTLEQQFTLEELTELALSADPDARADPGAVPFGQDPEGVTVRCAAP